MTGAPNHDLTSKNDREDDMIGLGIRLLVLALVCSAAVWSQLLAAAPASAALGFQGFTGRVVDESGQPANQAGAHPFEATTEFRVETLPNGDPAEDIKDIKVSLPPGFVGLPATGPRCAAGLSTQWQSLSVPRAPICPAETQVGVADIEFGSLGALNIPLPIFNLEPPPGVPARFGFTAFIPDITLDGQVRPVDHGIDIVARFSSQAVAISAVKVTMWGVPADPAHDSMRGGTGCTIGSPCSVDVPRMPFLTNPMDCSTGPLTTTIVANSWQNPDQWGTASFDHDTSQTPPSPMEVHGCDRLKFDPSITLQPTSNAPDSPTGLDVDLAVPQVFNPDGLDTAHLKKAVVTLPEGMTISPSAADGLQACTDAQLDLRSAAPATCPDGSKIGTVVIDTPLLDEPLPGAVFIRSQNSDDPASGEMFRMALEVRSDERGVVVKLPGQVRANPATGRLETTFDNNPQMPFEHLQLKLKGGPRAPLATPPSCGEHRIDTTLTSWADRTVALTDSFRIECPGQSAFAPEFEAGSLNPIGAAFSPFVAQIDRGDRQQFLSGVKLDMPKGLLARLRGVELCADAIADDGTPGACPAGSRIGTATVSAGPGSRPFFLKGDVYLTGPYKGGPYGLSVQVHAKAGPFDLGMVKVRNALYVDPVTAEVSVVSDPLPQIVKGVPVRLRSVNVDVDRPDFTVNPTSCSEQRIDATLTSINGAAHRTGSRFQVGDCQALPFKPRLGLRLTGRKQIRTGRHPGVRAVVRQSGIGEAGIDRARVVLPKSLALDPENAQALCEFDDGTKPDLENHCPKGSIVGRARAKTPLLDRDLVGDVYFVKNVRVDKKTGNEIRTLPMIVVALRGEIAINLTGKSSTAKNGRLVNTFTSVPDAPIGRFNLNIKGGRNGILAVTRTRRAKINLCAKPHSHIAQNEMAGQNGKRADYRIRVKTPCANAKKRAKAKSKRS